MKKELSNYIKSREDFERFCNLFLKKEVSPLVKVYSVPGPDGGIDAEFRGNYAGKSGHWVFQGKFRSFTDTDKVRRNIISVMKGDNRKKDKRGELDKANESKCDHYILITNVLLTAGNINEIRSIQGRKGYTFTLDFWDAEDLFTMTDEFPYILNSFRDSHLPVFLSYEDMFRDQINGDHRLLRYDYDTFGREKEIGQFRSFVQDTDKRLLVMYGSGGIGKTQLAIEFAKLVEQEHHDYEPLFVQIAEDSFENALADIPPNRKYIFFIDDAHDYLDNLGGIKILLNSSEYRGSKAVLITRKPFKASLKGIFLSALPDQTIDEIEIEKLSFEKTKDFIHKYTKISEGARLTNLARMGRDTPLIAVMVIYLYNEGVDLTSLTEDELVELAFESYLGDIFSEHLPKFDQQHRKLLDWFSGIEPLDLEDSRIPDKLSELLKVETYEIERYRDDLIESGLLVQYGRKQRVFPGPLSDYILRKACFLSDGRPSSFHKSLLEEFLPLFPINLIKNLARVEAIAGEKSLLDEYVNLLQLHAREGDNAVRMLILLQMEGICYFRPDDAIEIFNIILDNPHSEATEVLDKFWGKFTVTHQALVEKITKEAQKTVYTLSGFNKTLEIIRKLILLKDIDFSYGDRPEKLLKNMIRFETRKSFVFQNKALDAFQEWQREDKPGLSIVLLDALDSLFELDFHEVFPQAGSLHSTWYSLSFSPGLIQLRTIAMDLVDACLKTSQHNIVKAKAIECIRNALSPLSGHSRNNSDRLKKLDKLQLQKEQKRLFEILAAQIQGESDFTVLNTMDSCLHRYTESPDRFLKEKATQLIDIIREHQNYERYLLYRQFFGQFQDGDNIEKIPSFVKSYVSKYSPAELAQLMRECIDTAVKVRGNGAAFPLWEVGLQSIGELDPTYGKELLNHIFAWEIDKSIYASKLLLGIRNSDEEKARAVTQFLLNQNTIFAKQIVAGSYIRSSENHRFHEEDLRILSQLSETPDPHLRYYIAVCLPNFYIVNEYSVLEILTRLSIDESPWVSKAIINALIKKELKYSPEDHLETFKQVMENCLHLEMLDNESEVILHRIFSSDPIWVIEFFERRITFQEKEFKKNIKNFEAIPIRLQYLFKDVDWNDKYPMDALRRVRDWGLGPPSHRKWLAPGLLASMVDGNSSPVEGTKINNAVQTILEEWINSEDAEKIWWAACFLRNFDEDEVFYSLVESLLIKSKGNTKVSTEIEASIGTVGAYSGALGEPLPHLEKRIDSLKALRDKTESPIFKQFADYLTDRTKREIKREQQRDEEILEGEEW